MKPFSFLNAGFPHHVLLLSMLYLSLEGSDAQTPVIFFHPVASGLNQPLDIVNAADESNRMFIVERTGKIKILSGDSMKAVPFLDLTAAGLISLSGGERGLLSMAFHPAYKTNGYFFIYYTRYHADPALDGDIEISRFKVSSNPDIADITSRQEVITIPHHTYTNHNGGKLNFGYDSSLYFATGDGGSANDPDNNAQNLNSLLGKMIRILVNDSSDLAPFYTAPTDNPYASEAGARKEIFSIGLRNPFRWSFDRSSTSAWNMWIADVGQEFWEEINFASPGFQKKNYGWRCYEGNVPTPGVPACAVPADTVNPFFQYDHSINGGRAVTGGIVYRGNGYPALQNWYTAVDFYTGNGWLIKADRSLSPQLQTGLPGGIAAFGESETRELYAVSLTNGTVYQLQVSGIVPVKLQSFTATESYRKHLIKWKTSMESDMQRFELQAKTNTSSFKTIYTTYATNSANGNEYSFLHADVAAPDIYYRLLIVNKDGDKEYSQTLHLKGTVGATWISPTLVRDYRVNISSNNVFYQLQVIDMNGKTRVSRKQNITVGSTTINLNGLSKGIYIIRLTGRTGEFNQRIVID